MIPFIKREIMRAPSPKRFDEVIRKSEWMEKKSSRYEFFCPQCRSKRAIPLAPNPYEWRKFFRIALSVAFLNVITWHWFGVKGLFLVFPVWAVFELVYRLRLRAYGACPNCGFDPYLYLVDVKKARAEMNRFWTAKLTERAPSTADGPAPDAEKQKDQKLGASP